MFDAFPLHQSTPLPLHTPLSIFISSTLPLCPSFATLSRSLHQHYTICLYPSPLYLAETSSQTNCLTELLAEAIYDAEACDQHLALTGRLIGPLHGIPLSLKNQIGVASHLTNAGFVTWINSTSHDDAAIVKTFRKLGAVVFARTNQPQAGMHLETSNNIYGTTVNPRNRQLTAGGSTGGEAALMGMHASVLGIGGDIGGSIRVPAAFNGVRRRPILYRDCYPALSDADMNHSKALRLQALA